MKFTTLNFQVALTCSSLPKILQQHIARSLQLSEITTPIPLSLSQQSNQIVYRCALAFQLASQKKSSPQTIATQIIKALTFVSFPNNNYPLITFTIEQLEQGWINFYLSDRSLAVWLEQLPSLLPPSLLSQPQPSLPHPNFNPFPCQYAHARCCSLLRLAHREGLIELQDCTFKKPILPVKTPNPIPWFPILSQNPELQTITQLLTITEKLDHSQPSNWGKLATQLSQVILTVEQNCRIFGAIAQENPQIAQARLGLIALAQMLLKALLQGKMGLWTPNQL